ncbi:Hypothetical_protein [Hexamita inflata]|uniref:Hypothetical_protein n=1 Tax=Hexamita inflata TaxID=28002 RepID=A0AA86PJC7_9EUKA|nr:Hypothetical protein HINF_LOCUS27116 [Hexamita inflata]
MMPAQHFESGDFTFRNRFGRAASQVVGCGEEREAQPNESIIDHTKQSWYFSNATSALTLDAELNRIHHVIIIYINIGYFSTIEVIQSSSILISFIQIQKQFKFTFSSHNLCDYIDTDLEQDFGTCGYSTKVASLLSFINLLDNNLYLYCTRQMKNLFDHRFTDTCMAVVLLSMSVSVFICVLGQMIDLLEIKSVPSPVWEFSLWENVIIFTLYLYLIWFPFTLPNRCDNVVSQQLIM